MGGGVVTVSEISKKIFQQKGGAVKKKIGCSVLQQNSSQIGH
jgi:hypothetical protein